MIMVESERCGEFKLLAVIRRHPHAHRPSERDLLVKKLFGLAQLLVISHRRRLVRSPAKHTSLFAALETRRAKTWAKSQPKSVPSRSPGTFLVVRLKRINIA